MPDEFGDGDWLGVTEELWPHAEVTAVALEFKNLTDAFDLDQLPKSLREGLQWLAQQHDTDTLAN